MTLSPAAVVRDAWALARRDGAVLTAVTGLAWFLPAYAMALLAPHAPLLPADADAATQAALLTPWVQAVAPWYLLDLAIGLWGAASVYTLYLDREHLAVGAALARGARLWPRLALANGAVALVGGALALLLTGVAGGAGLIAWLPALLWATGRTLPVGAALAAERPLGAPAAVVRAIRLTRGRGLALAAVVASVWGAGLIAEEPLMAIDAWLRSLDGGNPVALAIVDAAAAGVSAAVALGYTLVAVAAYRRLAP